VCLCVCVSVCLCVCVSVCLCVCVSVAVLGGGGLWQHNCIRMFVVHCPVAPYGWHTHTHTHTHALFWHKVLLRRKHKAWRDKRIHHLSLRWSARVFTQRRDQHDRRRTHQVSVRFSVSIFLYTQTHFHLCRTFRTYAPSHTDLLNTQTTCSPNS
jgi:hypothetical protein